MSQFSENIWFDVEHCCNCGIPFAMTSDLVKRLRAKPGSTFYCPAGHGQHYTDKTPKQKLRDELERQRQVTDAAQTRAMRAETERNNISRAHLKMRARVMNGVCPCCNRTFQNLMNHMKSEHPEFDSVKSLFVIRQAFGMTQSDVAREAGVTHAASVSNFERGKPVSARVETRLKQWIDRHDAANRTEA